MKKIILALYFFLLTPTLIFGQGESDNWYFGEQASIRFNANGSVTSSNNSAMIAEEGSASVSDASGNLLFYTDGQTIFDRTHEVMLNGTGLTTNPTGSQTALIIPKPEDANILYVFSVDATTFNVRGTGLNYAIVDMSLNNGNGGVVQKNFNLLEDCAEKITSVIKDCATKSIWVITQATETGSSVTFPTFPSFNTLHAFEVTPAGVSDTSIKSVFNGVPILDDRGYIKVSPDRTKLASANMRFGLQLYDFDVTTGIFSNQERVQVTSVNQAPYGVEFSTNSQFLYVHATNDRAAIDGQFSDLVQFDLLALNITGSQILLDSSEIYRGALQMASNGKIYRALAENFETGIPFLGVINNPNLAGILADYQHFGLALNSGTSLAGLPPTVTSFFDTVEFLPDSDSDNRSKIDICLGQPLLLEVQNIPGATYTWEKDNVPFNNPDRNLYRVNQPNVSDQGNYKVTIVRTNAIECPIVGEIEVCIVAPPIADNRVLIVCDNDEENSEDGITQINLCGIEDDSTLTYLYFLSLDNRDDEISIDLPEQFINTRPFDQTIFYQLINEAGCATNGELRVEVKPVLEVVLDERYLICANNPQQSIIGPDGFDEYKWSRIDNSIISTVGNGQTFDPFAEGNYFLEAINVFPFEGNTIECTSRADFQVMSSGKAVISDLRIIGNAVEVVVTGDGDYEFSADDNNYQDSNIVENVASGMVTFYVRDKNGCGIATESLEIALNASAAFPNFFTPNNDGINDFWQVMAPPDGEEMDVDTIHIFNRNGNFLAQIDPTSFGWDGNLNGRPLPSSDYWFRAVKLNGAKVSGHFALKR